MDPTTAFHLDIAEAARMRRGAELLIAEGAARLNAARTRESGRTRFSITRAVSAAAQAGLTSGFEAEVAAEAARASGRQHDPHRITVPWSAFTRALETGTGTSGGFLVGAPTSPAADALFPVSLAVRLGATVIDELRSNISVPTVSTSAEAQWTAQLGTATHSAPTLGAAACSPKSVVAYLEVSRALLKQEPEKADRLISNHLLRVIGAAIDAAAFGGTGTDMPLGVANWSGVDVVDGSSFAWADAHDMLQAIGEGNANEMTSAFVGTPADRALLGQRCIIGTSAPPFIWAGGRLADLPAYATMNAPADTLIAGDFSAMMLLSWGAGLRVESNPYANFQAGIAGFRVVADVDVAIVQPTAFSVATSVS
jgi:HK97 family phage major capsid protein